MAEQRIFVGRKAELKAFDEVLRDPAGQAILVVGQQGMAAFPRQTMVFPGSAEQLMPGRHSQVQLGTA